METLLCILFLVQVEVYIYARTQAYTNHRIGELLLSLILLRRNRKENTRGEVLVLITVNLGEK